MFVHLLEPLHLSTVRMVQSDHFDVRFYLTLPQRQLSMLKLAVLESLARILASIPIRDAFILARPEEALSHARFYRRVRLVDPTTQLRGFLV